MRVLIVDDSAYARAQLCDLFRAHGHEVVGEARNAAEALVCCKQLHPDVVTVDLLMPDVGGLEAAGALRKVNRSCKIVMITAARRHAAFDLLQDEGTPIIHKPVSWPRLRRAIAQA